MLVRLEPEASIYDTGQTINVNIDPSIQSILFTSDNTAPTLAKYIAYDTLTPPNPFIATVQDGKGNAIFDGGFPKWYNQHVDLNWVVFGEMSGAFKYFANILSFIANPDKIATNKKILFLGDANSNENYSIRSTISNGFKTSFDKVCSIMGFTPTYKTRSSYSGGLLNPTYEELNEYCAVVVMSSVYGTTQLITDAAISNISAFREAGNGICIITDHGVGTTGFYYTANLIAANLGTYFSGNYNRTPVNVGFLRANYGDHPLYKNLSDSEDIFAGGSESRVFITTHPLYDTSNVPSIQVSQTGFTTLRFLCIAPDGSISIENYTYGINVNPPVLFKKNNITLGANLPDTYLKNYPLEIGIDSSSTGAIVGLIKQGSNVIGTFTGTTSAPVITFYDGTNIRDLSISSEFELEVQTPIKFFKTILIPLKKENISNILSLSRINAKLNKNELASNSPRKPLGSKNNLLGIPHKNSTAKTIANIRNYFA